MAIKEAFAPLFTHYLCQNNSSVWADLFGEQDIAEIKNFPNDTIVAQLNSLFHVDLSANEVNSRGSIRKIEREDESFNNIFKDQIGYAPNDWISSVLLNGNNIEDKVIEMIALEYSAACDYSNAKERTHRYMLGAIISEENIRKKIKNKLSNAVFMLPFKFMYRGQVCTILLHFNFSINEEESSPNKILGERLFSLKSEVMNMICDSHANHISRIGITCFC